MGRPVRAEMTSNFATQNELRSAIEGLTPIEKTKLEKLAKSRSKRAGLGDWPELLQEAIFRALSGSRRWPNDVPLIAFLAEVMRSIASESVRRSVRTKPLTDEASGGSSLIANVPAPDRSAIARILLVRIEGQFAADPAVRSYLHGLYVGETAQETMLRTGLGASDYDAARKRFRRAVDKLLDQEEIN
jgi:RNA polymerase sigma-70 factor (ECF subfamily)